MVGIAVVVTDDQDANSITVDPVKEMIREAIEIGPAQVAFDRMKPGGVLQDQRDLAHELIEKGVAKAGSSDLIVVSEHR
ncbi:MAG TPA: hypothetical protein VG734_17010 [Lacunisphaera sp.]|nr:hypothetical protein [Lacunisphaera sp.]